MMPTASTWGKFSVLIPPIANVGSEIQQLCSQAGMDDFVAKPMQRSDLVRVIDRFCH